VVGSLEFACFVLLRLLDPLVHHIRAPTTARGGKKKGGIQRTKNQPTSALAAR
jgi:hypothetical protein